MSAPGRAAVTKGLLPDVGLALVVFLGLYIFAKLTDQVWSWTVAAVLATGVLIGTVLRAGVKWGKGPH